MFEPHWRHCVVVREKDTFNQTNKQNTLVNCTMVRYTRVTILITLEHTEGSGSTSALQCHLPFFLFGASWTAILSR